MRIYRFVFREDSGRWQPNYRLQNNQSVADLDSVELDSYEIAVNGAGADWDYSVSLYRMNKTTVLSLIATVKSQWKRHEPSRH